MPHFPLFTDLKNQRVLIVGSGHHAMQKARLLEPFGPRLEFLPVLTEADLVPTPALVILAEGERTEMARLCRARHIPVNSVDDPENCTFYFPSLIRRGDVCIGISSGGAAPAASAALRRRVEQTLPEDLEGILPWLGQLTVRLRGAVRDYDARAAMLARICDAAFAANRPLTDEELAEYM